MSDGSRADTGFGSALRALRGDLLRRRHTALLAAIVLAFAVRPLIGEGRVTAAVFSVALLGLMFVALFAVQVDELVGERDALLAQRRRRSIVGLVLAVAALVERVAAFVAGNPRIYLLGSICWLAFFAFVTWTELRGVLKQKAITGEAISMSISVYLLLGFTWTFLYNLIFQMHPDAFNLGAGLTTTSGAEIDEKHIFPNLLYFSLVTLSTIGYGDITPLSLSARYAAAAEGITGQFYLAILVARLVAMQASRPADR